MVHLPNLIKDLALILASAGIVLLIFKKLKQPLVLGYIIAGILIGPNFSILPTVTDQQSIRIWADIGVIFLLFGLGIEFSFKKMLKVGGSSALTAVFEITCMFTIGYFTGTMLGWKVMDCIFLGGIISISSTTIIVRAFEELQLKTKKFATLVFGILVIEDLVAVLLLVLLSTVAVSRQFGGTEVIMSIMKLLFFLALWFVAGIFLIPTFLRSVRKYMNAETMLIISLALCLAMVFLAVEAGFSAALGAFVMGSILAETAFAERIQNLIKPVKDLFGAIFFVSVGMLINIEMLFAYIWPILILTIATILGKSISVTTGALIAGQTLRHSIAAGLSLSQIGEFSFIIATLGLSLSVTSEFLYPLAVAVSALTTLTTPYMIRSADGIYSAIEKILPQRWKAFAERYSSNAQRMSVVSEWRNVLKSFATNIVTNSVVLTALMLLSIRLLFPFIMLRVENEILASILTAAISLAAMSPFLWALAGKKLITEEQFNLLGTKYNRIRLKMLEVLRVALSVFFVSFLFFHIFSFERGYIIAATVMVITTVISSTKISLFYAKIEKRFIQNLHDRKVKPPMPIAELLPWDTHITELKIPLESKLGGKTLMELALREKFGINIVSIERGKIRIEIPKRDEKLYPGDIINVIGTDEELERLRNYLNQNEAEVDDAIEIREMDLQKFAVREKSPLRGMTLKEFITTERISGLIIGIERKGKRIVNPESTEKFCEGDIVWIVTHENVTEILDRLHVNGNSIKGSLNNPPDEIETSKI